MGSFIVEAISTETAEKVRATLRAPVYGFPAHVEVPGKDVPCRHCLRNVKGGQEKAILFTFDRFTGVETLPQPGPVYIHAEGCARFREDEGFPEELRKSARTLEAYGAGRKLLGQEHIRDGGYEPAIETLLGLPGVDYLQVNSTTAGCFTFRIRRK